MADPTASQRTGERLGPYDIIDLVGAGPHGIVYRARDTGRDRDVALKVLRLDGSNIPPQAFERARAAANLSHPNIATTYGLEEIEGQIVIVTDFIEGVPLHQYCTNGLPLEDVVRLGHQIAAAVGHAHRTGIVHGNLKSTNVLVMPDGTVKVLDVGLGLPAARNSETINQSPDSQTAAERLQYIAPERFRGAPANATGDVWAVGVMLYELSTGMLPYTAATVPDVTSQILFDSTPVPPMSWPLRLGELYLRCMAKDQEARYPDAAALAAALGSVSLTDPKGRPAMLWLSIAVAVVAVAMVGGYAWYARSDAAAAAEARRPTAIIRAGKPVVVAVLPFHPADAASHEAPLELGFADTLIGLLGGLPDVTVRPTVSVRQYVDQPIDAVEAGHILGVDTVVDGTVQQSGNQLHVTVRLLTVGTGKTTWSHSFDAQGGIVSLESAIGAAVAQQLLPQKDPQVWTSTIRVGTQSPGAFRAYVDGRYEETTQTEAGIAKAADSFDRALESDPDFPRALAELAYSRTLLGIAGAAPVAQAAGRARTTASHAAILDSSLGETHRSVALIRWVYDWNWQLAEDEFKRALELNPNDLAAHRWSAYFFASRGRFSDAVASISRARTLDPLSIELHTDLGEINVLARQYPAAITELQAVVETKPDLARAHMLLGLAHILGGQRDAGIAALERAHQLDNGPRTTSMLGYAYGVAGNRQKAESVFRELESLSLRRYVPPFMFAVVRTGMGDHDEAMTWLQRAFLDRSDTMANLRVYPWLDGLRPDPRFTDLLRKIDFGTLE